MNINKDNILNKVSVIACLPVIKETKKYKPKGFLYQKNLYVLNKNNHYVLANNMFFDNIKYEEKHKHLSSFKEVSSLIL